jgi:hypothetical protein
MNKTLKYAGISGIFCLLYSVLLIIFEILRRTNKLNSTFLPLYIIASLLSLGLYIIFSYGFILIGERYQNNLLRFASYGLIIFGTLLNGYAVLTLIYPNLENMFGQIVIIVITGAINIPFGIGLIKLQPQFGSIAKAAGVIEIISGVSLLTFILSFLGILLSIPSTILLSMILFRAAKKPDIASAV